MKNLNSFKKHKINDINQVKGGYIKTEGTTTSTGNTTGDRWYAIKSNNPSADNPLTVEVEQSHWDY
mgnify:FL=1